MKDCVVSLKLWLWLQMQVQLSSLISHMLLPLSVHEITPKAMSEFWWNIFRESGTVKETSGHILLATWITIHNNTYSRSKDPVLDCEGWTSVFQSNEQLVLYIGQLQPVNKSLQSTVPLHRSNTRLSELVEQGLTSHSTQFRSFPRRFFYRSDDPTNSVKALKEGG